MSSSSSSSCSSFNSCTPAFMSWHSSTLLSRSLRCLWIGYNDLVQRFCLNLRASVSTPSVRFFLFHRCWHDYVLAGSPLCQNCFFFLIINSRIDSSTLINCFNGPQLSLYRSIHLPCSLPNSFETIPGPYRARAGRLTNLTTNAYHECFQRALTTNLKTRKLQLEQLESRHPQLALQH